MFVHNFPGCTGTRMYILALLNITCNYFGRCMYDLFCEKTIQTIEVDVIVSGVVTVTVYRVVTINQLVSHDI